MSMFGLVSKILILGTVSEQALFIIPTCNDHYLLYHLSYYRMLSQDHCADQRLIISLHMSNICFQTLFICRGCSNGRMSLKSQQCYQTIFPLSTFFFFCLGANNLDISEKIVNCYDVFILFQIDGRYDVFQ